MADVNFLWVIGGLASAAGVLFMVALWLVRGVNREAERQEPQPKLRKTDMRQYRALEARFRTGQRDQNEAA